MTPPTAAVVLAAGEGRRLRPLTAYRPKPMLAVANRPIVDYVVDALAAVGVDRLVVVVGHRRERLQSHLSEAYPELEQTVVRQERRLGTGHALQRAASAVDEEFLVVNGDTVVSPAVVRDTVERARAADAPALAVRLADRPERYGVVRTADGRVTAIEERPAETDRYLVNAGVYALDRAVFDALDRTGERAGRLHLPEAVARLDPVTVRTDEQWLDPTTPWELLDATEAVLASPDRAVGARVAPSADVAGSATVGDGVVLGPGCEVGPGAVLTDHACVRANATVGPTAVLGRTAVGEGARVGAGATLRRSLVGQGARVGPGVVADARATDVVLDGTVHADLTVGCVVADRATVGGNVTLAPGSLVGAGATVADGATVTGRVDREAEVVR